ncbi:MAG TPA: biopolymer transporter ExbD, partial [Solimonas sp.]|nr:biopolymer transporter ExbD [Solimonas sp.]
RAEHPEASVIIQADKDARAGLLVEAMDQARLAGVKDVAVAAQPLR